MATKKTITIKLQKSLIGCAKLQKQTVHGLGLRKPRDEKTLENSSAVRGMIKKVIHLLDIVAET